MKKIEKKYSSKMVFEFNEKILKETSGLTVGEAYEIIEDEMNFSRFPDIVKRIEQGIYVTTTDDIGMLGRVCSRMPMFHDWFLPSLTKWLWIFDDHTEDCLQESLNETSKIKQ